MVWAPGDVVDIDAEDGMEEGAIILGPAKNGASDERRVRFKDGVVDDWPTSDFILRKPATDAETIGRNASAAAENEYILVVGGGIVGLSCASAVAKKGFQCCVLDCSTPDTVRGSRGDTRGLHFGYEGVYFDLVKESDEEWRALEVSDKQHRKLRQPCASLTFGSELDINTIIDTHARNGRRGANDTHQLEVLQNSDVQKRWPHISAAPGREFAVYDGDGYGASW